MPYVGKPSSTNYINRRFLSKDCIVAEAFENFSGRWTTQILFCIHLGLNRFGLIKQQLPRVSDRILGMRLNQLIESKLVIKKISDGEKSYALTDRGRGLIKILEDLAIWQSKFRS